MCSQPAFDKNNSCVRAPRPTKVYTLLPGETTTIENKPRVLFITRAVMCGYVARPFAVNRAVFKDRRRGAEDEIDVTLDIAVFEIMTVAINKQRILPTEEATIPKRSAIRVYKQRHCLRTHSKRILKRDVLGAKIIRVDERAERESRVARVLCAQFKGENGLVWIFTAKRDVTLTGAHSYLILINARLDSNHNCSIVVFGNVVQRGLDRLEIT